MEHFNKGIKLNIGNCAYYLAFILYSLHGILVNSTMVSTNSITRLTPYINLICSILCIIKIIYERYFSVRTFAIMVLATICAFLTFINVGNTTPIILTLLIISAIGTSHDSITKIYLTVVGGMTLLLIVLSTTGVIQNRIVYTDYNSNDVKAHCLGFTYSTTMAVVVSFILFTAIYKKKYQRKKEYKSIFLLLIVTYIIYYVSRSRLEFIASLILAIILISYDKIKNNRLFIFILKYSLIICAALTIIVELIYIANPTQLIWLDEILSTRLSQTAKGIINYGLKPFGQFVRMQGFGSINFDWKFGYFYIDSFYFNFLLQYGYVLFIIIIFCFTRISVKIVDSGNIWMGVFLLISNIHGIIISSTFNPYICPFYIIAYSYYCELNKIQNKPKLQS